jgi:hypothetical protein
MGLALIFSAMGTFMLEAMNVANQMDKDNISGQMDLYM